MKPYFVFDVESIGLHGQAFAVGGGVYLENGLAQREFRYACPTEAAIGSESDRKWVNENIPVIEVTHREPSGVRWAFWAEWTKAKADYPNILMAADCAWPVEARFLHECIEDDPVTRNWAGPYPLVDVSSVLLALGKDPIQNFPRTPSEMPVHDPLADARQSARILSENLKPAPSACNMKTTLQNEETVIVGSILNKADWGKYYTLEQHCNNCGSRQQVNVLKGTRRAGLNFKCSNCGCHNTL